MAIVAQLVRASDCGPEGRGFDSRQSPQFDKKRSNSTCLPYLLDGEGG